MLQESKIKVSVILPVYNPGPMISKCIETLRNQTLKEIEIIFVDDCSTDSSMDIIRDAATEDSRIKILTNEKNSGAGFSRNRGIEVARGEYLSFVDPDDYVALDFLELLYNKAKETNADIAKGVRIPIKEDGAIGWQSNFNKYISDSIQRKQPLYIPFSFEHQTAIYKKDLILKHNIRYGNSRIAQDTTFLLRVGSKASLVELEDEAVYYFVERGNSAMHTNAPYILNEYVLSVKEKIDYIIQNLSEDPYIIVFVKKFNVVIFKKIEYWQKIPELQNNIYPLMQQIKEQIERYPFLEKLKSEDLSTQIFLEKQIILTTELQQLPWEKRISSEYLSLLNKWISFYSCNKEYYPSRQIFWIKEIAKTTIEIAKQENKVKKCRKEIKKLLHPLDWKTRKKILKDL